MDGNDLGRENVRQTIHNTIMKVPCSLSMSELGSHVESPLHAFQGNQDSQIEFWGLWARAVSTQPVFCKWSCLQASGDGITDVTNYFNFCVSHTFNLSDDGVEHYQQTDTLDPDTFLATSATIDVNTYPPFLWPDPPAWNNLSGYDVDPRTVGTAVDWDKTSTRAGITSSLDGVNWTTLWAGSLTENSEFEYDRYQYAFDTQGFLPLPGALPGGGTGSGLILSSPGGFGPKLLLSGTVGPVIAPFSSDGASTSDGLGIDLVRTQLQVRNFQGPPISYFIMEELTGYSGVTIGGSPGNTQRVDGNPLAGSVTVFRKVTTGVWDHDFQIIQLPDAAMDGPQTISTSFGSRVRNGTRVSMVVGMTFEAYLLSILGPAWPSFVIT